MNKGGEGGEVRGEGGKKVSKGGERGEVRVEGGKVRVEREVR